MKKIILAIIILFILISCQWNVEENKEKLTSFSINAENKLWDNSLDKNDIEITTKKWIIINKEKSDKCTNIPKFVKKVSYCFTFNKKINEDVIIKINTNKLWNIDKHYLGFYSLVTADGIEGEFWSPLSVKTSINEKNVTIELPKLAKWDPYFIWLEKQY